MTMTAETAAKLRERFPAEAVGKLPRITCPKCRDSRSKACDEHQKSKCRECGNYITPRHLHLDYVGHAEVTDRLLQVDPEWSWEPVAFTVDGLPALDSNGGLWIRLTVAGTTRIGYGHADGKGGADAVKESIGDALRNAAMRFGVALDLWGAHGPAESEPANASGAAAEEPVVELTAVDARKALAARCEQNGWDLRRVADRFLNQYGQQLGEATDVDRINGFSKNLYSLPDAELKAAATNGAQQ